MQITKSPMSRIVAAAILAAAMGCGQAYAFRQVEVVDGDTITVPASGTSPGYRIRVMGIDAPELHGKCPDEIKRAQQAKARLAQLVSGGVTFKTDLSVDRYGRLLAQVLTRADQDVAQILIGEGLGRPYDGKGARQPWCPGAPAEVR